MSESDTGCKVDRVAAKYDMDDLLDERLLRRRKQDASLRDLGEYADKQILKRALTDANARATDERADHLYSLLQSDEDSISYTEVRQELQREDVDPDELVEDFVSYQTIRKHLNECLDVDTSTEYEPNPREDRSHLGELRGRAENVAEKTLNRLIKHDVIRMGEPDAIAQIKVRCGACGRTHDVDSLIRERACPCADTPRDYDDASENITRE